MNQQVSACILLVTVETEARETVMAVPLFPESVIRIQEANLSPDFLPPMPPSDSWSQGPSLDVSVPG